MRRLILALISILISQILPLLGRPELILSEKNLIIMLANAAIWLTQPPLGKNETKQNKKTDQFSVILILFFSIGSIVVSVIEWGYFSSKFEYNYWSWIGLTLVIIGVIFRAWSINILGKFFTATVQIKDDHQLITKGPYSLVRHPSYLGAWATITGAAVFFKSYAGIVFALVGMGVSYYIRIKIEEEALLSIFGEQYRAYQKRVKRIIPFIW